MWYWSSRRRRTVLPMHSRCTQAHGLFPANCLVHGGESRACTRTRSVVCVANVSCTYYQYSCTRSLESNSTTKIFQVALYPWDVISTFCLRQHNQVQVESSSKHAISTLKISLGSDHKDAPDASALYIYLSI